LNFFKNYGSRTTITVSVSRKLCLSVSLTQPFSGNEMKLSGLAVPYPLEP